MKYRSPGSSPRMRGTRTGRMCCPAIRRFIPAYAGNTLSLSQMTITSPVHPRVCGEHPRSCLPRILLIGSSPRMRGTRCHCPGYCHSLRFIPAYTGNTDRRPDCRLEGPVHPRVCGEHSYINLLSEDHRGSSPRMRGTRSAPRRKTAPSTVHPRVCGEHLSPCRPSSRCSGSSPRMRGTPLNARPGRSFLRFIPAYAGNTSGGS